MSAPSTHSETNGINGSTLSLYVRCILCPLIEFWIYLIMKNCKSKHDRLLTENKICLFCNEIKFLSIRSLTFTTEVSIRIVTISVSIRARNFLLLNTFLYSLCTLFHILAEDKHNPFVLDQVYPMAIDCISGLALLH